MMANSDLPEETETQPNLLVSVIKIAAFSLVAIFSAGAATGYVQKMLENDHHKPVTWLVAFALPALAALFAWLGVRETRRLVNRNEPQPPRIKRARAMLLIALGIGALIGLALGIFGDTQGASHGLQNLQGDWPPAVSIGLFVLATATIVPTTIVWHRNIDEHEAGAYRDGAIWGGYTYIALASGWWVLARGQLVAEPDAMILFVVFCFVWSGVWLWRRYT